MRRSVLSNETHFYSVKFLANMSVFTLRSIHLQFFLSSLVLPRPFNPLCTLESTESLEYSITRILLMRPLISLDC